MGRIQHLSIMPLTRVSPQTRRPSRKFDMDAVRAVSIRSVATDLGFQLSPKGGGRCRLPGHADRNPSFGIQEEHNRFTCYACGGKGDVIDLVRMMNGLDFVDACGWLTDYYLGGVRGPQAARPMKPTSITRSDGPATVKSKPTVMADPEVYGWLLQHSPLGMDGETYLLSRSFSRTTIDHFRVGQIGNRSITKREAVARFGAERVRRCGLLDDRDRFIFPSGYLLFPYMQGEAVDYLQARRSDSNPKWRWLCPLGVRPLVFNTNVLADDVSTIAICEGVTDVLSAHQLGRSAIGLIGADGELDDQTILLLRKRNVAVYGDADSAGGRFAARLVKVLSARGISAIPKRLPEGVNDLNDLLRATEALR